MQLFLHCEFFHFHTFRYFNVFSLELIYFPLTFYLILKLRNPGYAGNLWLVGALLVLVFRGSDGVGRE